MKCDAEKAETSLEGGEGYCISARSEFADHLPYVQLPKDVIMPLDPQTKLMHDAWLKAFRDGEVRIPLPSKSDLTNIRFKLYNAARSVKKSPPGTNFELEDAVANCSIRTEDETVLVIYRKDKSAVLQAFAQAIGSTIEVGGDTKQIASEADAMLKRLMGAQAPEEDRDTAYDRARAAAAKLKEGA